MENKSQRQARETRMQNNLRREITEGWWKLDGLEFAKHKLLGLYADIKFDCWFYCNLKHVRVQIDGKYGLEPSEKTFDGETAWSDCVAWVIEEITRMTDAVQDRVLLLEEARQNYLKAIQGV